MLKIAGLNSRSGYKPKYIAGLWKCKFSHCEMDQRFEHCALKLRQNDLTLQ